MDITEDDLKGVLYECDIELDPEEDVRVDYSGRGMYGASCFGIVTDDPGLLLKLGAALQGLYLVEELRGELARELLEAMSASVSQDSMGLSSIVYFPRVHVELDD